MARVRPTFIFSLVLISILTTPLQLAQQSEAKGARIRRPVRAAPARPNLSSSLGSENEDNEGKFLNHHKILGLTATYPEAEDSEELASTDTELGVPTVEQMRTEVSEFCRGIPHI